jgi:SAM-dependent methyltransferase
MGTVTQSFLKFFRGGAASREGAGQVEGAAESISRRSSGLTEFTKALQNKEGLSVLDLGATSPTNISYFTNLGHRLYNEDVLLASSHPEYKSTGEDGKERLDTRLFLQENMVYSGAKFDAVLCWDIADYLEESLVKPAVERIHSVLNPGGILLAFFHTRDAGPDAPYYRYHIASPDTLRLQRGPHFRLQRVFNNRHIENLFRDYGSLKFFLSRDNLREVLVTR